MNENLIIRPYPGPILTGEEETTFPFPFQENGLGDAVWNGNDW